VKFVGDLNPVSMPGEIDEVAPDERDKSFHIRPVWQRFLIVLAGPLANFLLAILIFAAFFAIIGFPMTPNVVGQVQPASTAQHIGLKPGDRIDSIAGQSVENFEDIRRIVSIRPDETVTIEIERAGHPLAVQAKLGSAKLKDEFGQQFRIGVLGILQAPRVPRPVPLLEVIPKATKYTLDLTRSMVDGLAQIVSGKRSTDDLGGPLKMAQIAGQQASLGFFEFIQLVALFSINLGFINLLPVPMLDGGHLALYTVEAVQRRPVSLRAQEWAFRGGLAFLLALLLFTTLNDLGSFGLWESVGRLIG
jgi:regulator of sigma E protease